MPGLRAQKGCDNVASNSAKTASKVPEAKESSNSKVTDDWNCDFSTLMNAPSSPTSSRKTLKAQKSPKSGQKTVPNVDKEDVVVLSAVSDYGVGGAKKYDKAWKVPGE